MSGGLRSVEPRPSDRARSNEPKPQLIRSQQFMPLRTEPRETTEMPQAWIGRRRRALLVGIRNYQCPNLHNLKGCTNDARLLGALLSQHFDFGVVVLCDSAATRQAILRYLELLASCEEDCEEVIFFFSGHGSRILTKKHGPFETLVPHDSHRPSPDPSHGGPNRDITDRELYGWVLQASNRADHVTLVIDACRAGGIVRDLEAQPRGVQPDFRSGVLEDKTAFLVLAPDIRSQPRENSASRVPGSTKVTAPHRGWRPPSDVYTLLAACRDEQFCREMEDPDSAQMHGIFSLFLSKALQQLPGPTSWRELRDHIARRVEVKNPKQDTYLEGAMDREVFGRLQLRPEPFRKVVKSARGEVLLDGGAAHGLVNGSTWRLFTPATRRAEGDALGEIRIDRMTATRAWGRPVLAKHSARDASEPTTPVVTPGSRAFEVERPLEQRLRVLIDSDGETAHRELELAVDSSVQLRSVDQPEQADVVLRFLPPRKSVESSDPVRGLVPLSSPHWAVVDPSGQRQLAPAHDIASRPRDQWIENLVTDLERLARQHFLKTLCHPEPASSLANWIRFEVRVGAGAWSPFEPTVSIPLGERFALRLSRHSKSQLNGQGSPPPLYVAAIDLGLSGSVSVFYPRRGRQIAWHSERLEIGTRPDDALFVQLPEGYPYLGEPPFEEAIETVLLVFSRRFTDFDSLSQVGIGQTRNGSDSPVFGILDRAIGGLPQRSGASTNLLSYPDQWGLVQCSFRVVKVER